MPLLSIHWWVFYDDLKIKRALILRDWPGNRVSHGPDVYRDVLFRKLNPRNDSAMLWLRGDAQAL